MHWRRLLTKCWICHRRHARVWVRRTAPASWRISISAQPRLNSAVFGALHTPRHALASGLAAGDPVERQSIAEHPLHAVVCPHEGGCLFAYPTAPWNVVKDGKD